MELLSVVIITFNEERNIRRCLTSIASVADEIIIVDAFSTDQTQTICNEFNVCFIQHKWNGYVAQKNFAIAQASHDLVLSIDADEALSETLLQSIMKVKEDRRSDGYTMNRLTNFCGQWIRHGGWYPDKKLRLFDRNKGSWTGLGVHEYMALDPTAAIIHLPGDLLHYSFNSVSELVRKNDQYSGIRAQALYDLGKRARLWQFILKPPYTFFRTYVIKGGFLDGFFGLVISISAAYATFLRYAHLYELEKANASKI